MKKPPSPTPSELEAHLGYWLRFVSNHVSQAFRAKLATCSVMVAEWVVLRELYAHDDLLPSTLASRLGMTRGGITKLIDRLEKQEFLARAWNREDRRSHTVSLTARGRNMVPRLAALADQNEDEFFGHLSAAKRTALRDLLTELVAYHKLHTVPLE